jgi:hypothetical protein
MPITVGELIDILKKYNQDRVVILEKDAEGNGYSLFRGVWEGAYREEGRNGKVRWSMDVGLDTLTDKDRDNGFTEKDVIKAGKLALILHP